MEFRYTPRDLHGSKKLFTGRTSLISEILKNIYEGRSIAAFGERQIGKTLLLLMIRDIINDAVDIEGLIDEKLKKSILEWNSILENTVAIFIDLQRYNPNENNLVDGFLNELKKMNTHPSGIKGINVPEFSVNSMGELLEKLSELLPKKVKLVILIDEMECLEKFQNSDSLFGVLRNASIHYENLKFIHTGSYEWEKRIIALGEGSLWNHLKKFYLGGIDENDAANFLIRPLAQKFKYDQPCNPLTNKIIEWSGCKPLLIQEICYQFYLEERLPHLSEIENILLKCLEISDYIRDSIFEENQLEEDSRRILKSICHNPSVTINRISKRLKLKEYFVKDKILNFDQDHFDTVHHDEQGIQLNGKLIQRWGKDYYVEENQERVSLLKSKNRLFFQWGPVVTLFLLAMLLFFYTHPGNKTEIFSSNDIKVILEVPHSLEVDEEGHLNLSIQNLGNKMIDSLKVVFLSPDIEYKCTESNILSLSKIASTESRPSKIKYRVRFIDCAILNSKIVISGIKDPMSFNIKKRPLPVKKYYGGLISYLTAILGFFLLLFNIKKIFVKTEKE